MCLGLHRGTASASVWENLGFPGQPSSGLLATLSNFYQSLTDVQGRKEENTFQAQEVWTLNAFAISVTRFLMGWQVHKREFSSLGEIGENTCFTGASLTLYHSVRVMQPCSKRPSLRMHLITPRKLCDFGHQQGLG